MKKVNLNGKLSFKKETIAKLNNEQMNVINGGAPNTFSCLSACSLVPKQCCSLATNVGCNKNG